MRYYNADAHQRQVFTAHIRTNQESHTTSIQSVHLVWVHKYKNGFYRVEVSPAGYITLKIKMQKCVKISRGDGFQLWMRHSHSR